MAINYTTYTEVDPNAHIAPAASSVTITGLDRNEDAYLYNDFGPGEWSGNFTVDFDFNVASAGTNSGSICDPVFLANAVDDINGTHTDYISARLYPYSSPSWNVAIFLTEKYASTVYNTSNLNTGLALGTTYYARVKRVGTAFTYVVYASSADRSSETSPLVSLSLTLHGTVAFRYFFPVNNYNSNNTPYVFNGTLSNHDIVVGPSIVRAAPDTVTATDSVSLTVYNTITDSIVLNEAILLNGATYKFITDTVVAVDAALTSYKEVRILDTVTGVDIAGSINQNSLVFGVHGFPSGQTVEYRIKNQQGVVIKDWTSVGVIEDIEIPGYSTYAITNVILDNGFQGKVSWRINGTNYYAVEILNFFESFVFGQISVEDIEASTVLAKEATVASRLATSNYTAPDNAGIAALLADTALLIAFIKNKKYLEKTGATWYLVIRNADDSADILRKALKGTNGTTEITDITAAAMGMEIKSAV